MARAVTFRDSPMIDPSSTLLEAGPPAADHPVPLPAAGY